MGRVSLVVFLTVFGLKVVYSVCPGLHEGTPPADSASIPPLNVYIQALAELDIEEVFDDIYDLLTDSQECWPADTLGGETSYGGLFIRLTWHCAGTYRTTDDLGGCAGGRQRFSPEASWDDNTNLDKARGLLAPIKTKYGDALSWGDLMVFAGTAAIKYMGGPVTTVCAGRIDNVDGTLSEPLNNATQCPDPGNCPPPLASSTIGLIYVNPEGVNGIPDPAQSAPRIREIFGRMGMNDEETVALIGGGHAFGKSHGACPLGAGLPPNEAPLNPWPGNCDTGMGEDTFTSGIEGQWTTFPFRWDNEYFTQLINDNYTLITGPGNKSQWLNNRNGYMMLTTDIALIEDSIYYDIVESYANNINTLNTAFGNAWQKLVEDGNGWVDEQYRVCVSGSVLDPFSKHDDTKESLWDKFKNLNVGEQIGIIGGLIVGIIILVFCLRYTYKCICQCCCGVSDDSTRKYTELSNNTPTKQYGGTTTKV